MSTQTLEPILIKRYARSRLYRDPANQRYVTVKQLRDWMTRGIPLSETRRPVRM